MPVALHNIRELMLPGLQQMAASYTVTKEQWEKEISNSGFKPLASKPLDLVFTLDEIHQAEAEIEAINGSDQAAAGP